MWHVACADRVSVGDAGTRKVADTDRSEDNVEKSGGRNEKTRGSGTQNVIAALASFFTCATGSDLRHTPHFQMTCFLKGMSGIQKSSNQVRDVAPTTAAAVSVLRLRWRCAGSNLHATGDIGDERPLCSPC